MNKALQELDVKKDCNLTFSDIWADYRNFKDAYYYHQEFNPAEYIRRPEAAVEVDMEKFSLRQQIWDTLIYGNHREQKMSPGWSLATGAQFLTWWLLMMLFYKWFGNKYDWKDPLQTNTEGISQDAESVITEGIEKKRYQKRKPVSEN